MFLQGFWEKRVAERGLLMVNLWWNAGERWCSDGRFLVAKNMPPILDLFLDDSRFGNVWGNAVTIFGETALRTVA